LTEARDVIDIEALAAEKSFACNVLIFPKGHLAPRMC